MDTGLTTADIDPAAAGGITVDFDDNRLLSALFGAAPLWLAVVADTGATVAVTLNGLRLLRVR